MTHSRKALQEEILYVLRNSDDALFEFRKEIEGKDVIIFLGNTRNGKSTLVSYITGSPLVVFQDGSFFKITHPDGASTESIGHGSLSCTDVPAIIRMPETSDTLIIDAPGFDDNRGPVQEVVNALYINQIKYCESVRFVLVSEISNIANDNINQFLSFIETVQTIMPDINKLKNAVSIIFTKDWKGYTQADISEMFQSKILNVNGISARKDLVKHFAERQDLIGLFRMPKNTGALTEDVCVNVRESIFASQAVNLKESDIKYGISKRARVALLETYLDFFDTVNALVATFKELNCFALKKLSGLEREKLLSLEDKQLDGQNSARKAMREFNKCLKVCDSQTISATDVPVLLQTLYVEELNKVALYLYYIDIEVPPQESDFRLEIIDGVRKKVDYITAIEKVVEKNNKSQAILASYKENVRKLSAKVYVIDSSIYKETETRVQLITKIRSIPDIDMPLNTVDYHYLSASFKPELIRMEEELVNYDDLTDIILGEISDRPAVKQKLTSEFHRSSWSKQRIQNKLIEIRDHIAKRNSEVFLNISSPLYIVLGTFLLFTGFGYVITRVSSPNRWKIFAGSFVFCAFFSWRSKYTHALVSRIHKRCKQRRFTFRTPLDDCWKMLNSESYYPF